MLYQSYEQVITRDRPEYWWRPGRHADSPVVSQGRPGTQATVSSLATISASEPYTGPGLPGAATGTSSHCIGTSTGGQGWQSTANHTIGGTNANGWTMEAWILPTANQYTSGIYRIFTRGTDLAGLWSFENSAIFSLNTNATVSFNDSNNPGTGIWKIGQWMHLVGIFRTGSSRFYTNGVTQTGGVGSPYTTSSLVDVTGSTLTRIGGAGSNRRSFPGYVAEAAIYDYALSWSQVQDHYHAGLGVRRSPSRFASIMTPPAAPPPPPPGGLTVITSPLANRRVAVVSDRPR